MAAAHPTQALVRRAQTGDQDALGELFKMSRDRLESTIRTRMGQPLRARIEVEDIIQETFVWATRSITRFRWRGEDSFYQWLRGIAEHMLLKAANQRKRDFQFELIRDVPATTAAPSKIVTRQERFDRLEQALQSLPREYREVLLLSRIQGLRVKEIAQHMNRSPNAVSLLLSRALKKLRATFGDTESLHLPDRTFREAEGEDDRP